MRLNFIAIACLACACKQPNQEPPKVSCPGEFDAAIEACVGALLADPDNAGVFLIDAIFACSDAEPIADDFDAFCAAEPDKPLCADFEQFVFEVLPECVSRVQEAAFAEVCVFPGAFDALLVSPGLALLERRQISSLDALSSIETQQLEAAAGVPPDVALELADGDGWQLTRLLEVAGDRQLVFFTANTGGTGVDGAGFFAGTTFRVASVVDGVIDGCAIESGLEGRPCLSADECEGSSCQGIATDASEVEIIGSGVCAPPTQGGGEICTSDDDCTAGFVCVLFGFGADQGSCNPGWMRRSYQADLSDASLVSGGVLRVPFVVSGLATVANRARIDLQIQQETLNTLRVTLINPPGTRLLVVEDTNINLFDADTPVIGDESVNGSWILEIEDLGGAAAGSVADFLLTLDSRFD